MENFGFFINCLCEKMCDCEIIADSAEFWIATRIRLRSFSRNDG
ncbi:hypothetical protein ACWIUD_07810 [Helicobacter sp. 23-1044]